MGVASRSLVDTANSQVISQPPDDIAYPVFFAGLDEAGRGCLAGPVVAAAVILPPCVEHSTASNPVATSLCLHAPLLSHLLAGPLAGLTDSKQLTEKRRLTLEPVIKTYAPRWGIGVVWPWDIDRINILQATYVAMGRALAHMRCGTAFNSCAPVPEHPVFLAVDGNKTIPHTTLSTVAGFCVPQAAIIGGDGSIMAISAASVLAKTFRDRLMIALDKRYPGYGFAQHKGYGTKVHKNALKQLGPCRMHRHTFAGVGPIKAKVGQGQHTLW